MINKTTITLGIVIVFILIAIPATTNVLLNGASQVKLGAAEPLAGAVSQSLYAGNSETTLPIPGKDYNLTNTHYFDSQQWVVTTVASKNNAFSGGIVILEKEGGVYRVVGGPGTALPTDYTISLPTDVGNYLRSGGYLYGAND